jgi:aspartyl protease family protein
VYCECTYEKIKEKGMSIASLEEASDPGSPFFNEVVMPCVTKAMTGKNGNAEPEETTKSPGDIAGNVTTAKIPLTRVGGVYNVKVLMGGITKYFILDSGASDVFISSDLERELLLEGLIKREDYLSKKSYKMANGEMEECRRLKLDNIQIGDYTISNVIVAINANSNGMLLLGKSFLDKFSHWSIDNGAAELVLTR